MTTLAHRLDRTLVIEAPQAAVFKYFTDPVRWAAWWGAGSTIDARPGGRVFVRYPTGDEASGEVVDVDAPSRIVFTYGYVKGVPFGPGESRVTIRLEAVARGTRLSLEHEFADAGTRDPHEQGWRYQLSLFANVVTDELHGDAAATRGPVVRRMGGARRRDARDDARRDRHRGRPHARPFQLRGRHRRAGRAHRRVAALHAGVADPARRRCAPLSGHGARGLDRDRARTGSRAAAARPCSGSTTRGRSMRSPASGPDSRGQVCNSSIQGDPVTPTGELRPDPQFWRIADLTPKARRAPGMH